MVGASVGGGFSVLAAGDNNIGNVDVLTIAAGDNNIGNVDIASALPAGTNAIGKLAANSGVDIGDVDVTSIAAGDNNIGNVDIVTLPALVAGAAIIGTVGIDQTTPGTTNRVDIGAALPAGTNAIGKLAANSGVDIGDVDILSIAAGDNNIGNVDIVTLPALVAGAAIIGTVGIDQTTPGTTNRVDIGAALPAGTNAIGKLAANSGVDIGDVDILSIAAGDNNIGNVDIVTLPALAAGTNNIGDVDVLTLPVVGEIITKNIAAAAFTITLASLANAAARQSTLLDNSSTDYPAALVHVRLKSGAAAPTAGTVYEVYLLRSDGTIADDAAGASDAAITIENAPLLGTIVLTATAAKNFYGVFDTSTLGPLGPTWGIAIKNSSAQTVSTTEGDHAAQYTYYVPEIQ